MIVSMDFRIDIWRKHALDSKETAINRIQTDLENFVDEILHILVMENIYMRRQQMLRFLRTVYLFTETIIIIKIYLI